MRKKDKKNADFQENNQEMIKMDQSRSSKVILAVFFLAVIFSVAISYWKIVIRHDYMIISSTDCDPSEERCFVHVCNPEIDGAEYCTGDEEEDTWYTKNISRRAYNIPDCDPSSEECKAFDCEDGEEDCFYELCGELNVPEGDNCNDPDEYSANHLVEEEDCVEEECIEQTEEAECAGDECANDENAEGAVSDEE